MVSAVRRANPQINKIKILLINLTVKFLAGMKLEPGNGDTKESENGHREGKFKFRIIRERMKSCCLIR